MSEETKNDLFDIRLNETGIYYIRKTKKLLLIVYILVIISTLTSIIFQVRHIVGRKDIDYGSRLVEFYIKGYPFILIIVVLLNFWSAHFLFTFFRELNRSVENKNEIQFNQSIRYALRNARVFLAAMIINITISIMTQLVALGIFL